MKCPECDGSGNVGPSYRREGLATRDLRPCPAGCVQVAVWRCVVDVPDERMRCTADSPPSPVTGAHKLKGCGEVTEYHQGALWCDRHEVTAVDSQHCWAMAAYGNIVARPCHIVLVEPLTVIGEVVT